MSWQEFCKKHEVTDDDRKANRMNKDESAQMRIDIDRACGLLEHVLQAGPRAVKNKGRRLEIQEARDLLAKWSLDDEPAKGNTDD